MEPLAVKLPPSFTDIMDLFINDCTSFGIKPFLKHILIKMNNHNNSDNSKEKSILLLTSKKVLLTDIYEFENRRIDFMMLNGEISGNMREIYFSSEKKPVNRDERSYLLEEITEILDQYDILILWGIKTFEMSIVVRIHTFQSHREKKENSLFNEQVVKDSLFNEKKEVSSASHNFREYDRIIIGKEGKKLEMRGSDFFLDNKKVQIK